MSVWADAAGRYRDGRELRTQTLRSRFVVQFDSGTLALFLPNGAIRRVDSGEFASAWALFDADAPKAAVRMVTPNGDYLEAIRRDLRDAGLGQGSAGTDDDVDVGTTAAALIEEATARNSPPDGAGSLEAPGGREGASQMHVVLAERDELVRDLARHKAALAVVEERLAHEELKTRELEAAMSAMIKTPASAGTSAGAKVDPVSGFVGFVEAELAAAQDLDPRVRAGIKEALTISTGHPDLAVVQCRKVAEAIAQAQYLRVTGAAEIPQYVKATDLMEDVRDRQGVDMVIWNLHRNVFRISNPAAHVLHQSGSREFALTLVAMVLVVATHIVSGKVPSGPRAS